MSEPNAPKTGGLWARLMNLQADAEPEKAAAEKPDSVAAAVPLAEPVDAGPVPGVFVAVPVNGGAGEVRIAEPVSAAAEIESVQVGEVEEPSEEEVPTLTDVPP